MGGHGTGRDEDRDGRKRAEESFRSIASARGGTRYEARAVQEKVTAAAGRPCVPTSTVQFAQLRIGNYAQSILAKFRPSFECAKVLMELRALLVLVGAATAHSAAASLRLYTPQHCWRYTRDNNGSAMPRASKQQSGCARAIGGPVRVHAQSYALSRSGVRFKGRRT